MVYTEMTEVSSFLKMDCDLKRTLISGSSPSSDHRSRRITKECLLNPHVLQVYRVRLSGGCTWILQLLQVSQENFKHIGALEQWFLDHFF